MSEHLVKAGATVHVQECDYLSRVPYLNQWFYSLLFTFIRPFSPSSHKYNIGHIKLSLHSLHYIKTFMHILHNKGTCNTFALIVVLSNVEFDYSHSLIYNFCSILLLKLVNTKDKMCIIMV